MKKNSQKPKNGVSKFLYLHLLALLIFSSFNKNFSQTLIPCGSLEPDRDVFEGYDPDGATRLCQIFSDNSYTFNFTGGNSSHAVTIQDLVDLNGSTIFFNKKIHIIGDIEINQNITFVNCWIKVDAGKEIKTTGTGRFLRILRTKLFGCDYMWEGINITGFNKIEFSLSQIEDAEFAINLQANTIANINESKFINDNLGITNEKGTKGIIKFMNLFGLNFACTSPLLSPHSGSDFTNAGIFLTADPVTVD